MQYKHRWLYAIALSLMLIATSYYYDLQKKFMHLAELQRNEKKMVEELAAIKPLSKRIPAYLPSLPALEKGRFIGVSNLVKLAHVSGLSIQSIKSLDGMMLHFITQGHFEQISFFIEALETQHAVRIVNFSCRLTNQLLLQMEADILLPMFSMQQEPSVPRPHDVSIRKGPFCVATTMSREWFHRPINKLQSFPLQLIKMVGYLQQGQRAQALLLLPNRDLVAVDRGLVLGKEQGRVITIQPHWIEVKLPNRSQIITLRY